MTVKFVLEQVKWLNQIYYTVQMYISRWDIDANLASWDHIDVWSRQIFGQPGDQWNVNDYARWYIMENRYWFRDEKDRTLFLLRWK